MKTQEILKSVFVAIIVICTTTLYSQGLTIGGQVGWGIPQGDIFSDGDENLAKGGLSLDLDALYHFESLDYKLAAGLNYNGSILFGQNTSAALDVGIFGLSLYGVKVHYSFFESKVTPYVSLSTGVSQFSTPEISDGSGNVLVPEEKSFSFGLRPEIGLDLAGFIMSAGYFVPMKYGTADGKAGVFQVSLGLRYNAF